MTTQANGFQYIVEPGEVYMPDDLPTLENDSDDEQRQEPTSLTGEPMQRGRCSKTIDFVVLRKPSPGTDTCFVDYFNKLE